MKKVYELGREFSVVDEKTNHEKTSGAGVLVGGVMRKKLKREK